MTIAVIFSSTRALGHDREYAPWRLMEHLASRQPGYLGIDSVRDGTGKGITVSYWADEDSARAWKAVAEHVEAQEQGRSRWYAQYQVVVAEVIREYSGP